jgi:hypothetical protein
MVAANKEATEPRVEVITAKVVRSSPWLGWPLWNICVTNDHEYAPLVANTSGFFPHSWPITGFITRLTRRVSLVEQELLTLPEHLRSPPVFSGVHVTRSLVLWLCFVDHCLSFCFFSFGRCIVCSSIYGFWLPLGIFNSSYSLSRPDRGSSHPCPTLVADIVTISIPLWSNIWTW